MEWITGTPPIAHSELFAISRQNPLPAVPFSLYVLCAFALILSMSFPVNLHGIIYDFHSVPLVIGSLYGGPVVSILLYATLILYHCLLGNPHNLIYAASLLPGFFLVYAAIVCGGEVKKDEPG